MLNGRRDDHDRPDRHGRPGPDRPVLLRLPFSHYCRKAEACLSQAGIGYDALDVGLRRMPVPVAAGTVPVLRVGDALLTDSADIVRWADRNAAPGTVPLRASDPAVRAWMDWADEVVGPLARRQAYRCIHANPAAFTDRRLLRLALRLGRPLVLRVLKAYKMRRFEEADRAEGPRVVARIADGLADAGTGHLVGDHATAADLTVANLVDPLVRVGAWAGLDREPGWGAVAAFVAAHRVPSTRRGRRRARTRDLRAWAALGRTGEPTPTPGEAGETGPGGAGGTGPATGLTEAG